MLNSPSLYADARELTEAAKEGTQRVHLKEAHIRSLQAVEIGSMVTVTLGILSEQEDAAAPVMQSTWQFDFESSGNGWRIHEIRAVQIGEMNGAEAQGFMPKVGK